jgi:serine/threonine protein kinase
MNPWPSMPTGSDPAQARPPAADVWTARRPGPRPAPAWTDDAISLPGLAETPWSTWNDGADLSPGRELRQTKVLDVIERIGEGGMGRVYRAFDPLMDRYVALKVLKLDVVGTDPRRFRREAVVAANFNHPNLPRVLDRGADRARRLEWMTMEYLSGRDLGQIVERGRPVPLRLLVDLFAQTLDALDYIHARRIVHCDVKPRNIFITRDPCNRRMVIVKLIDFGVCRSLDGPIEVERQLVGDPRYMAPEQTVLNGPIDPTVDLYSLGIAFYEALMGRHPFPDMDELGVYAMLQRHVDTMPPPPSHCVPQAAGPLGQALDDFIATACAKRPERRYADAKAMKRALLALPLAP